jgi:hypothetical protein
MNSASRHAATFRLPGMTTACFGILVAVAAGCGGEAAADSASSAGEVVSSAEALTASALTGAFTVSATDVAVGTPITVTQAATNPGSISLYPVIVGIYRVGFQVTAVTRPATGLCRVAGSATCNFLDLAPGETQLYTLTLVPTRSGTFVLSGWTRSSYVAGGSSQSVTVTVR